MKPGESLFDETHTPGEAVHENPKPPENARNNQARKKKEKKKSIKTLQKKEAIIRNSKKRTKTLGQQEPGRAGPTYCFAGRNFVSLFAGSQGQKGSSKEEKEQTNKK